MTGTVDDTIRTVSKMLCGAQLRLPVAIWIRSQPRGTGFYQRQIAQALQTDSRYLRREFHILHQLGMLTPQPSRDNSDVRRFYQANHTHPLWAIIDTAAAACTQNRPDQHPRSRLTPTRQPRPGLSSTNPTHGNRTHPPSNSCTPQTRRAAHTASENSPTRATDPKPATSSPRGSHQRSQPSQTPYSRGRAGAHHHNHPQRCHSPRNPGPGHTPHHTGTYYIAAAELITRITKQPLTWDYTPK